MILIQLETLENGKLPYPTFIDQEGKFESVGRLYRVVGFAQELEVQRIDMMWDYATTNLGLTHGMYLVTVNDNGSFETWKTPVKEARELEEEAL